MQSRNIIIIIMRKTANYRVVRLSTFCTDPAVAEIKMRKAIGGVGGSTTEEGGEKEQIGETFEE